MLNSEALEPLRTRFLDGGKDRRESQVFIRRGFRNAWNKSAGCHEQALETTATLHSIFDKNKLLLLNKTARVVASQAGTSSCEWGGGGKQKPSPLADSSPRCFLLPAPHPPLENLPQPVRPGECALFRWALKKDDCQESLFQRGGGRALWNGFAPTSGPATVAAAERGSLPTCF